MDLRQLQYFITCVEKGSLTRAAEELYTTQPHVSQVIRSLEGELGVKLFRRTGSGILPTAEGERIRFYAVNALKNAALIREVSNERERETLRISTNPSSRLALWTGRFFTQSMDSGAALQYTECGIEEMMELLQRRQYDLGLLFLPSNRISALSRMAERRLLRVELLGQSDLVVYGGEKSPFYGRKTVSPLELDGCRCIQAVDDFFSVETLLMEHEAFHSGKCSVQTQIRTNSDHMMLRILRETGLCNIGSYWKASEAAQDFSLSIIEGFEGKVSFGYLRHESLSLSRTAKSFLDMLREDTTALQHHESPAAKAVPAV